MQLSYKTSFYLLYNSIGGCILSSVRNKVDLEYQREVSTMEGMALAQIWGCSFVEASAKHRTNVNEVFSEIVREVNLKNSTIGREIVCECCSIS